MQSLPATARLTTTRQLSHAAHPVAPLTRPSTLKLSSTRHRAVCQASEKDGKGLAPFTTSVRTPVTSSPSEVAVTGSSGVSLDLASSSGQATVFGALSATSGLLAAGALLFPEGLLDALLPVADRMGYASFAGLDPTLLRVAGATLVISAAAEYCLQDAAANNRLTSATYQRLMVACVFKSTGYLLAFALAQPVWTPLLIATYPTAAALSVYVNMRVLIATNNKDGVQTIPNLVPALKPTNTASWVYSGCVVLYLLTALACYAPPDAPSLFLGEMGASSELLKHTWAPGFILAAMAAVNLKDAADRGRLGASTFKRLNLGLALLELIYSGIFIGALSTRTAAGDFSGLTNLIASLGIAGYCLNNWMYAKK